MQLYKHQQRIVDLNPDRILLNWACGCLHRDTLIYDPINKTNKTVYQRFLDGKKFNVYSIDENRNIIITTADCPLEYTKSPMIEFTYSNGKKITVTPKHRIFNGQSYFYAEDVLRILKSSPFPLLTIEEPYLLESHEGGLRLKKKSSNFLSCCQTYFRLYGQLLHEVKDTVRSSFPLPIGVLSQYCGDYDKGGLGNISKHNHQHRDDDLPSKKNYFCPSHIGICSSILLRPKLISSLLFSHVLQTLKLVCLLSSLLYRTLYNIHFVFLSSFNNIIFIKSGKVVSEDIYYDFHVPIYNNYIVDGVVHHNTGKSIAAIILANNKPGMNVLIICPKSVKEKWQREVKAFGDSKKNWLVITKETFRRDYKEIGRYDIVINDEVHFFSSLTSQMSKSFSQYLKAYDIKYRILLTATSYMSTPWNIYMLAKHLGRDWNYMSFRRKFFYDIIMGGRSVPVIKSGIEDEIARLVATIGDIVKIEDAMDMPEQIYREEYFELNPNQKREITLINQTEFNPVVKYTKIHQIVNGTLKGDGYVEDRFFPYEKSNRIMEYCENTDKVAVVCRYNLQIKTLAKMIQESHPEKKVFIITGETQNRDQMTRDIDAVDKCIVLIGSAVSEGYEVPSVNLIIFASLDFSYKNYSQMCGRFLRINRPTKNVYVHMIVKDTIDEAVYKSMLEKKDFDVAIYNQAK